MTTDRQIRAFIWDFDGTLVDSRHKNLRVTQDIVAAMTGREGRHIESLSSMEAYERSQKNMTNWRDFYQDHLGLSEEQTDEAGRMWSQFQLRDRSGVPPFEGILETLSSLRSCPHGIVSQNSKTIIERSLHDAELAGHFGVIVGYEQVHIRQQKPAPDGLMLCLEKLRTGDSGVAFYVGDHETDMQTVRNTNQVLKDLGRELRVLGIAAAYQGSDAHLDWKCKPDFVAQHPQDIVEIEQGF